MARYNVKSEARGLATLTGRSIEDIIREYDLWTGGGDEIEAWGRRGQIALQRDYGAAREAESRTKAKAALQARVQAGAAIWRMVGSEWLVQTGAAVQPGDMIDVQRRDGSTSQHIVSAVVTTRADGTSYVRV